MLARRLKVLWPISKRKEVLLMMKLNINMMRRKKLRGLIRKRLLKGLNMRGNQLKKGKERNLMKDKKRKIKDFNSLKRLKKSKIKLMNCIKKNKLLKTKESK